MREQEHNQPGPVPEPVDRADEITTRVFREPLEHIFVGLIDGSKVKIGGVSDDKKE